MSKLGVLYYRFPEVEGVDKLASERDYKNRDVITISPDKMGDVYEEKVKTFFKEHLHEDEEIRYILDGNGYFDVRSERDEWIRIRLDGKYGSRRVPAVMLLCGIPLTNQSLGSERCNYSSPGNLPQVHN